MDNLSISRSFSPSAAFAISVETCRQVGLRRYCSGRFVDQVPHIGEGRKLHAGVSLSTAKRCARLKRTNCTNREGRQKSAVYSPSLRRELFACRCCSGLAYASQQKDPLVRNVSQSQKIRMSCILPSIMTAPVPSGGSSNKLGRSALPSSRSYSARGSFHLDACDREDSRRNDKPAGWRDPPATDRTPDAWENALRRRVRREQSTSAVGYVKH